MAKIIFKIKKDGTITSEVKGVSGSACLDYLDTIKEITGGEIIEVEKTPEFYQYITPETETNQENKNK